MGCEVHDFLLLGHAVRLVLGERLLLACAEAEGGGLEQRREDC